MEATRQLIINSLPDGSCPRDDLLAHSKAHHRPEIRTYIVSINSPLATMRTHLLALILTVAVTASALPSPSTSICNGIEIPITVSVPRFIINTTVKDNWDAATLTLNLTRRDFSTSADPLPISG